MGAIKLKKLTVTGPSVRTSSIEFGNKLTIIAGPSDTGKTCIYRCLNYIFGQKNEAKKQPLDVSDGYDNIILEIETPEGDIILSRKLKSHETNVESHNPNIESGVYLLKPNKKNSKTVNSLFLSLLGLKLDLQLPSNEDGKPEAFSWRTIKKAFFVDEERADKTDSILLPREGQTLYIAGLIYFLTGDELDSYKIDGDSPEIKAKKRKAIIDYITNHKNAQTKRKEMLEKQLQELGVDASNIDEQIKNLSNEILKINDKIEQIVADSRDISSKLIVVNERLSKNRNAINKYENLKGQYASEISRLSFIVDNEELIRNRKQNTKCPYCENEIVPKNITSFIQASQSELMRVVTNANELEDTTAELQDLIEDDTEIAETYNEQITNNTNYLNENLIPKRDELKKLLDKLNLYVSIQSNIKEIENNNVLLDQDIETYSKEKEEPLLKFKAKEQLYNIINQTVVSNCTSILNDVGYENVASVMLDSGTLDIVVNGKQKINRGKGFKAFTNSILLLAFRKYIEDCSTNKSGLYFFDSPLKGLHLPEGLEASENIRKGFFDYLINLATDDQIVILENTNEHELPDLVVNEDTKIYKFTKKDEGRYGFLLDVR